MGDSYREQLQSQKSRSGHRPPAPSPWLRDEAYWERERLKSFHKKLQTSRPYIAKKAQLRLM